MVFSSAIFLFIFLPAVFLLYRLCRSIRSRNILLAAASIVFYAFGQLIYVPLFLLSVIINYVSGRLIMNGGKGKAVLAVSVILNLAILCVFKYTDFLIANLNFLLSLNISAPGIELPIGISFFTFQGMSYVIDVYRDKSSGTKSFLKLLLYISFFPQLIAGPIVKYHDIAPQLDSRLCTTELTEAGILRFIKGLAKKLLIANTAGYIADLVFGDMLSGAYGAYDFRVMWLGAICYTLQIYYDFSGYSDMAIGMAKMFGFAINENFLYPYGSCSLKEFWRKWHISLSTWFKEYLYIPLGGNRKGRVRTVINRLTVFLLTGLWHGANWTFVIWGLGHGILSSLEDLGVIPTKKLGQSRAGRIVCKIYTLLAVVLLFVIFRADSISSGFKFIGAMFSFRIAESGSYLLGRLLSPASVVILVLAIILSGNLAPRLTQRLSASGADQGGAYIAACRVCSIVLLVLSILSLSGGGFNPFIYFQF